MHCYQTNMWTFLEATWGPVQLDTIMLLAPLPMSRSRCLFVFDSGPMVRLLNKSPPDVFTHPGSFKLPLKQFFKCIRKSKSNRDRLGWGKRLLKLWTLGKFPAEIQRRPMCFDQEKWDFRVMAPSAGQTWFGFDWRSDPVGLSLSQFVGIGFCQPWWLLCGSFHSFSRRLMLFQSDKRPDAGLGSSVHAICPSVALRVFRRPDHPWSWRPTHRPQASFTRSCQLFISDLYLRQESQAAQRQILMEFLKEARRNKKEVECREPFDYPVPARQQHTADLTACYLPGNSGIFMPCCSVNSNWNNCRRS